MIGKNIISNILFYTIWLPICLLLVGGVMLWAILCTLFAHLNFYIILTILVALFYIGFPMFAIYQTYNNPNFGNQYGKDFNLKETKEKIKKHQEEQKEKWTTDHK